MTFANAKGDIVEEALDGERSCCNEDQQIN